MIRLNGNTVIAADKLFSTFFKFQSNCITRCNKSSERKCFVNQYGPYEATSGKKNLLFYDFIRTAYILTNGVVDYCRLLDYFGYFMLERIMGKCLLPVMAYCFNIFFFFRKKRDFVFFFFSF